MSPSVMVFGNGMPAQPTRQMKARALDTTRFSRRTCPPRGALAANEADKSAGQIPVGGRSCAAARTGSEWQQNGRSGIILLTNRWTDNCTVFSSGSGMTLEVFPSEVARRLPRSAVFVLPRQEKPRTLPRRSAKLNAPLCIALTAFTRMCYWEGSTSHSGGHDEAAGGTNDLSGDPG